MTSTLERVKATWRTKVTTDDDLMTVIAVHVSPRVVVVAVSAVKDENYATESWHIVATEGGEVIGSALIADRDLWHAMDSLTD